MGYHHNLEMCKYAIIWVAALRLGTARIIMFFSPSRLGDNYSDVFHSVFFLSFIFFLFFEHATREEHHLMVEALQKNSCDEHEDSSKRSLAFFSYFFSHSLLSPPPLLNDSSRLPTSKVLIGMRNETSKHYAIKRKHVASSRSKPVNAKVFRAA